MRSNVMEKVLLFPRWSDPGKQLELLLGLLDIAECLPGEYLAVIMREKATKQHANYLPAPFDVRPPEQDEERSEDVSILKEPDISMVCDLSKLDDTGCTGAPDLAIEILSPSTKGHDRFTKFNLYQRAGVREYWIAASADKSVQVFVLEDGRYTAKDFGAAGDTVWVNVLKDCTIDLSQVFPE